MKFLSSVSATAKSLDPWAAANAETDAPGLSGKNLTCKGMCKSFDTDHLGGRSDTYLEALEVQVGVCLLASLVAVL